MSQNTGAGKRSCGWIAPIHVYPGEMEQEALAYAVLDDEGNVTVFCVNRDMGEEFELEIDLRSFGDLKFENTTGAFS